MLLPSGNGYSTNPSDADYTTQQDAYILNAPFANGNIVFAEPNSSSERLKPYLQNWRAIDIEYEIEENAGSSDITKWIFTDESGVTYIFAKVIKKITYFDEGQNREISYEVQYNKYGNKDSQFGRSYSEQYINEEHNFRWYLTEIRGTNFDPLTLQGDRIIIEYQSERALFQADIGNDEIIAERDFWEIDDVVFLESTDGTLPEPFVGGEQYFVVAKTDVEPTIRLKLSSIQGGNPINIINQGTGTHIVKKAPVEWYDAFYVSQVSPLIYLYKYTIQWDGSEEDYVGAGFGSPFNICKISPVYPVRIYSNNESAEFMYSRSNDINIFGRKKLDEIIVKKTENFRKKIKFIYDDIGLAKNHSYSEPGKGLLQLLRIINVGKDGTILPMLSFEYTSNPDADLFRHDFYGYRSPVDIRTLNPYEYPEGQSQIGDQSNPGSEAWSIKKVIYGTGKIEEYEYEPNEIVALSTNEDIATEANKLFCGIRVKEAKDYSGIGDEMLVTTYEYGKGYAPFSYELEEGVSAFYQTLRGGEFGPPGNEMESINNVIGLRDIYASYSYCKKSIANSGVTKIHFLNPSSNVESYGYSEFTADPGSDELIIGEDIWNVNDGVESRI